MGCMSPHEAGRAVSDHSSLIHSSDKKEESPLQLPQFEEQQHMSEGLMGDYFRQPPDEYVISPADDYYQSTMLS